MSQVQFAQMQDIPSLVELGRQIHAQSRYAWMPFSAKRLWSALETAIPNKQHCLIVALESSLGHEADKGQSAHAGEATLMGVLWACAQALPFCNEFVAQVDTLYVMPKHRGSPVAMKMMTGLRRWANNRQVAEILIPNAFGVDQVYSAKLLGKLGLKPVGGVHSMWMER